jgi:pyroglutamyl-peptidase
MLRASLETQTLITGFGPFEAVASNPTERLAQWFAVNGSPGHAIVAAVLPVSYHDAALHMRALICAGGAGGRPFDRILMLGVAPGAGAWRVERFGRNLRDARPDASGVAYESGPIVPGGPKLLPVSVDPRRLRDRLAAAGITASVSSSAGGYLCNFILYTTLLALRESGSGTRACFLHVPADERTFEPAAEQICVRPFADSVRAVQIALAMRLRRNRSRL